MRRVLTILALVTVNAFGQTIAQPDVYTRKVAAPFNALNAPAPPAVPAPSSELFSSADLAAPADSKARFGASSEVYSLKVYGIPKCMGAGTDQTCVSTTLFNFSVNANVINAASSEISALREYVLSRKGSPLSITAPLHTWTTKKGDVRQSWFAFSPYGSGRLVPVTGGTSKLSAGFAATGGATVEAHFEFDATTPGSMPGEGATYPGTLFFSATPTASAVFGNNLQTAALGLPGQHFVWGGEYRVGFQFKGQNPISLGITGTYSQKGFTASHTGMAITLSKLFGASK